MNVRVKVMWRSDGVFLALACAWLAGTCWVRNLALPDEGRYVGVAWEMVRSGRWLVPTLNDLPFFHKPPLFYWITAASFSLFGVHDWAARLAPLMASSVLVVAIFLFIRRWIDAVSARWSVVVLVTQPLFFGGAQYANPDMLVAGCMGLTILLAAHGAMNPPGARAASPWVVAAWGVAALGVLSKGLIGIVLPVIVLGIWSLSSRDRRERRLWRPLVSPTGMAVFIAVAAPWFAWLQWKFPGFLEYFFVTQQFGRFLSTEFNNGQSWWYYPAALFFSAAPWTVWMLPRIVGAFVWRRSAAGRFTVVRSFTPSIAARADVRSLMTIWLGVIVVFFSIPHSKLIGYILPVLAPLAVLVVDAAGAIRVQFSKLWISSLVVAVMSCVTMLYFTLPARMTSNRTLAEAYLEGRGKGEPLLFVGGYFYDAVYYARYPTAVDVIDDWDGSEAGRRDNWEKELLDAAGFSTAAQRVSLVEPEALAALLCASRVHWLIATLPLPPNQPWLARIQPVAVATKAAIWRIDNEAKEVSLALGCKLQLTHR